MRALDKPRKIKNSSFSIMILFARELSSKRAASRWNISKSEFSGLSDILGFQWRREYDTDDSRECDPRDKRNYTVSNITRKYTIIELRIIFLKPFELKMQKASIYLEAKSYYQFCQFSSIIRKIFIHPERFFFLFFIYLNTRKKSNSLKLRHTNPR